MNSINTINIIILSISHCVIRLYLIIFLDVFAILFICLDCHFFGTHGPSFNFLVSSPTTLFICLCSWCYPAMVLIWPGCTEGHRWWHWLDLIWWWILLFLFFIGSDRDRCWWSIRRQIVWVFYFLHELCWRVIFIIRGGQRHYFWVVCFRCIFRVVSGRFGLRIFLKVMWSECSSQDWGRSDLCRGWDSGCRLHIIGCSWLCIQAIVWGYRWVIIFRRGF